MYEELIKIVDGMTVKVKTDTGYQSISLGRLFTIEDLELIDEFATQSSLYAYFSILAAKAEHASSMAAFDANQERANSDLFYREKLAENAQKATEPAIKAMIDLDEDVIKATTAEHLAKLDFRIIKALTSALEQRANMLVSMGAYARHEMDQTNLNIRKRAYDNSVEETKKMLRAHKNK